MRFWFDTMYERSLLCNLNSDRDVALLRLYINLMIRLAECENFIYIY